MLWAAAGRRRCQAICVRADAAVVAALAAAADACQLLLPLQVFPAPQEGSLWLLPLSLLLLSSHAAAATAAVADAAAPAAAAAAAAVAAVAAAAAAATAAASTFAAAATTAAAAAFPAAVLVTAGVSVSVLAADAAALRDLWHHGEDCDDWCSKPLPSVVQDFEEKGSLGFLEEGPRSPHCFPASWDFLDEGFC